MAFGFYLNQMPWLGLLKPPSVASSLVQSMVDLNGQTQTFTRATSAYDPMANAIVAPGVVRTRPVTIDGTSTKGAALIEGPQTNLLAAGSSDRVTVGWSNFNLTFGANVATLPNGDLADSCSDNAGNASHFIAQSITKAASALPFAFQVLIQAKSGNTKPLTLINVDDGAAAGISVPINLSTGALGSVATNAGGGWSGGAATVTQVGSWYRVFLTGTSNTSTTFRPCVFVNNAVAYVGDGTGGFNIGQMDFQQAAFPSSYISNRNLLTYSNVFSNAIWTKNASLTVAQTGGLMPSGETGWTVTTATGSDSLIYNLTVTASTNYVASWWAKLGTTAAVRYTIWDNTHSAYITSPFNYAGSLNASTYTRVSFSFTTPAGCTAIQVIPITWTGVAGTALCGDVQTEYGTTPTAYWGTNATVGGRDADNLSVSLAGITDTRQNYLAYSEQIDNAIWTKRSGGVGSAPTVTANFANDPNGNPYAERVQLALNGGSTATDRSDFFQTTAASAAASVTAWSSVWMKSNTGSTYNVLLRNDVGGQTASTVCSVTPSWQRFSISESTGTGGTFSLQIGLRGLWGTSDSCDILVAQCAVQPSVSDPGQAGYLPTAGTAVTATQTGLSTTSGTIVALGVPYGRGTSAVSAKLYQTSVSSGSAALFDPTGSSYRDIYSPFSSQAETNGALSVYASTWNPSVDLTYAGGAQIATVPTTATTAPYTLATSMAVGSGIAVAAQYYGWVWLGYWHNTALTAGQILAISNAAHA